MEIFNEEKVYDEKISPLMKQIIEICNKHKIPMVASFTFENCPERGPGKCTTLLNSFENRKDDVNQRACKMLRTGGHETFAITVKDSA